MWISSSRESSGRLMYDKLHACLEPLPVRSGTGSEPDVEGKSKFTNHLDY